MAESLCRACKKRPVPDRGEPEAHLREIRERANGLCHECAIARHMARLDQTLAYLDEKGRLGLCIVRGCTAGRDHDAPDPPINRERCREHRLDW